jgi:prepilin-type N-terminal cleavage/methylation domain-containing protein
MKQGKHALAKNYHHSGPFSFRELRHTRCDGFSLVEVLVASALLALAVMGTGYLFIFGQASLEKRCDISGAVFAASIKVDELENLPPSHADLTGAPFPGELHPAPGAEHIVIDDRDTEVEGDDLMGYRRWKVMDVDDPANGTTGSADYKEVWVEVAEDSHFKVMWVRLRVLISP